MERTGKITRAEAVYWKQFCRVGGMVGRFAPHPLIKLLVGLSSVACNAQVEAQKIVEVQNNCNTVDLDDAKILADSGDTAAAKLLAECSGEISYDSDAIHV